MNKQDTIIISSRVRLARNFRNVPFPSRLTDERAFSLVINSVYKAAKKIDPNFKIFTMETLTHEERLVLFEKHLISKNLLENAFFGGVILSPNEEISIMLNEEDHIRAQCIMPGLDLEGAYQKLSQIDNAILENCDIAFDKRLGFLTACPTNLGTGLRASVMLFLPALSILKKIDEVIAVIGKLGQTVRGAMGEGSMAEGYLFQVSNQVTLGFSESEILQNVNSTVQKICDIELAAREELLENNKIEITDICMRALGILTNSYKMDSREFNDLFSKVKLGAALGILNFKNDDILKTLSTLVQPATLTQLSHKEMSALERDIFRAEYLRKILKDVLK